MRSLLNVGSIFRIADAFLLGEIYLCGITATPPHREIHKSALGAEESVSWKYFKTTAEALHLLASQSFTIVAIEQAEGQISLQHFQVEGGKNYAFVFGNEISGVSEEAMELCHHAVEIPQAGTKHSLNVAVCAGIIAWQYTLLLGKIE